MYPGAGAGEWVLTIPSVELTADELLIKLMKNIEHVRSTKHATQLAKLSIDYSIGLTHSCHISTIL